MDANLPHISVEMPVYKEILSEVMYVLRSFTVVTQITDTLLMGIEYRRSIL